MQLMHNKWSEFQNKNYNENTKQLMLIKPKSQQCRKQWTRSNSSRSSYTPCHIHVYSSSALQACTEQKICWSYLFESFVILILLSDLTQPTPYLSSLWSHQGQWIDNIHTLRSHHWSQWIIADALSKMFSTFDQMLDTCNFNAHQVTIVYRF